MGSEARFAQEVLVLANLHHANVVRSGAPSVADVATHRLVRLGCIVRTYPRIRHPWTRPIKCRNPSAVVLVTGTVAAVVTAVAAKARTKRAA